MGKRRKFSAEFKREAVAMTQIPGATVRQVAADLDIGEGVLGRWRRELRELGEKAYVGQGQARTVDEVAVIVARLILGPAVCSQQSGAVCPLGRAGQLTEELLDRVIVSAQGEGGGIADRGGQFGCFGLAGRELDLGRFKSGDAIPGGV